MLHEAFDLLETDLIAQMRDCKLSDSDGHTRLVMALQMAGAVRRHLWRLIQDGHEAQADIDVRGTRID